MSGVTRAVGRRVFELAAHANRLTLPGGDRRRVVVFPALAGAGTASDLRGFAVARELTRQGWRALAVPPHLDLAGRRRLLAAERPDVVLIHQTRHALNDPRLYPGVPCVFDADDADITDPRLEGRVVDCLRASAAVVAGSRFLAERYRPYNPNVAVVWTGSYLRPDPGAVPNRDRGPVVAWAASAPLDYPREAEFVRRALADLAGRTRFEFHLYGVAKEKAAEAREYLEPIRGAGVPVRVVAPLPYRRFARRLESAAVGLQPVCPDDVFSRGKSFGKLLAYMAAGVAVVAADAVDHPLFYRDGVNGRLVGGDPGAWADAVAGLLADPAGRHRLAEAGTADYLARLTTAKAAELVGRQLERAIGRAGRSS
jgi:glycosyltransferase involved in cell wall biosynthesis